MCRFITAVLPAGADIPALSPIANRHGRRLLPLANASLDAQLRSGEVHCLTTMGHCDCDSALGRFRVESASDRDAEVRRLRRKGWGASKIERALQQREIHHRSESQAALARAQPELQRWRQFLEALLEVRDFRTSDCCCTTTTVR